VRTADWEVTITEVLRGDEAKRRIEEEASFMSDKPAPAGKEYVLAKARVRYIGTENSDDAKGIDALDFNVMDEKNVLHPPPLKLYMVIPEPGLDASLFPGGQAEGWIGLEVDTDEGGWVAIFEPTALGQEDTGDKNKAFLALE